MTNINKDDKEKESAEALLRSNKASKLKTHIKEPLEAVITPLLTEGIVLAEDCIDAILLLIFTHIDLLGSLYKGSEWASKGKDSAKNAVEFIREYLGRVDPRYKEVGGLLYYALRHGLVHSATLKRIQLPNGMILDFSFVLLAGQRQEHLKVIKTHEIQRTGNKDDIYRLFLNLSLLYEDLLDALDKYAEDIRKNEELSKRFQKTFETRRKPDKVLSGKPPYIHDSDIAFVTKQTARL